MRTENHLLWQDLPPFSETEKLQTYFSDDDKIESSFQSWLSTLVKYDDHRQFQATIKMLTGWHCLVDKQDQSFFICVITPEDVLLKTTSSYNVQSYSKENDVKVFRLTEGLSVTLKDDKGVGMNFKVVDGLLRCFSVSRIVL